MTAARRSTGRGSQRPLTAGRIAQAACRLIEDVGHEAMSLRALARELDVTAPAIYDHFDAKADVLEAVADIGFRALVEHYGDLEADHPRAVDRCRAKARAYVSFAQRRPELFRVMFLYRPAAIMIESDNELPAATEAFQAGSADVARAVTEGDLADRDPTQLALTLWASVHGLATIALSSPALSEVLVDDVLDAVFRGLRPEG